MAAGGDKKVFGIPKEPRTQVVLAHQLGRWINATGAMLWLTDWPMYTPEEMDLFLEIRRHNGVHQALIDAPGQVLDDGSEGAVTLLMTLLSLMMAFNWEGYIAQADGQATVWMADEIVETLTVSPPQGIAIQRVLDRLYIQPERAE